MTNSTARIEVAHVVDTHALVWYLTKHERLSNHALAVFQAAERGETLLIVPAIVVAELYYVHQKTKAFENFERTFKKLEAAPHFVFTTFTPEQVLDFPDDHAVPGMHDRMIVGVARRLGIPVLTADTLIIAANLVEIVW